MDYEKKYKEIVGLIKKAYLYAQTDSTKAVLEEIFPELSESEDEKVRKALAEMVHDTTGDELWVDYNVHKEEALAWLEKQGEKKSQRMISAEAKEAMYDKPAWSEEDEEMFDAIIADIQFTQKAHTHDDNQAIYEREIDWLESLKQRIGG